MPSKSVQSAKSTPASKRKATSKLYSKSPKTDLSTSKRKCAVTPELKSRSSARVGMNGPAAQLVKELINSDGVVIFSKTYCPYCKMAKEVFDKLKQKYTAIELDNRDDGDAIQSVLGKMTGTRSVPRVFVKGKCLGGGTDVKKLYDTGKLVKQLK